MKIDLTDIARGRRITAVCAKEFDQTPRKGERPKVSRLQKKMRSVSGKLKRTFGQGRPDA